MSTPTPIKIWRDPTRMDVVDLLKSQGRKLKTTIRTHGCAISRSYSATGPAEGETLYLGHTVRGSRTDWRAMLKLLGSDWA